MARKTTLNSKQAKKIYAQFARLSVPINDVIDEWQRFNYARHNGRNPKAWTAVGPLPDATSAAWTALLIHNVADNTLNVMKAIMVHDNILEEDLWPPPRPLPDSTTADELRRTAFAWITLDDQIFKALNSFYGVPTDGYGNYHDGTPIPNFPHDSAQKLAVQAIDFINCENDPKKPYTPRINVKPIPGVPIGGGDPNDLIPYLLDIELAFHRLIQEHMQIASFIPKHLQILISEMKAKPDFNIYLK